WYGKVSTAVLYMVMLVLIAFPHMNAVLQFMLIIVCVAALTLSFVMYMRIYFIMLRDSKSGNEDKVLY
ncbi:MAG: CDP-alcohol phosphatidyltransferase family protein, partial [Eubacteriales bacterium]|nr:CDP-alcohol phosphatidyltransferase family protein [Eubacteriales bacterium]